MNNGCVKYYNILINKLYNVWPKAYLTISLLYTDNTTSNRNKEKNQTIKSTSALLKYHENMVEVS